MVVALFSLVALTWRSIKPFQEKEDNYENDDDIEAPKTTNEKASLIPSKSAGE